MESFQQLQQEMTSVAAQWQECEKRIDDYVDEQVYTLKSYRKTVGQIKSLLNPNSEQEL